MKIGHYKPKQSLNDQVFTELEQKGMSNSDVGNIVRSGRADSGAPMSPKMQNQTTAAGNINNTPYIPDNWMD